MKGRSKTNYSSGMSSTHLILSNPWKDQTIEKKFICEKANDITNKLQEIATNELREDENTRKQCLEQFREWVKKNQDIQNCLTNDEFLLRFLRVKKFSITMAEQTLLKYLNFRKRFKDFMYGMDFEKSVLINNGYIFASPYRDSNGRRVIIYNLNKINPHEMTGTDIGLAHAITYETLLADEEVQILGVNHVADLDGASPSFLTLWSVTEFATIVRWGEVMRNILLTQFHPFNFQQSLPMRHKEINLLNFPTGLKYIYDLIQSNIKSQKLKDRISIHSSTADLHKKVNKRCLPLEFGGVMPMKEMVELWKKEVATKRDLLLSYDSINLLSDKGIICRRNRLEQDETGVGSLPGSFRKLQVD